MAHETEFTDGTPITPYLATAFAEGFCEGEDTSTEDRIRAFSYLCGTGLGFQLQGSFGRAISNMINIEVMTADGTLDWDTIQNFQLSHDDLMNNG